MMGYDLLTLICGIALACWGGLAIWVVLRGFK